MTMVFTCWVPRLDTVITLDSRFLSKACHMSSSLTGPEGQDNPLLHCADLRFDRTSYPNEIQNFPVVQIDDSKLLVQMMLHGVL